MALLLLALVLLGCEGADPYYLNHDAYPIVVDNQSRLTLDIYLDDQFTATLTPGALSTRHDVLSGHHLLEAYDSIDGGLAASRSFYLDREFVWILE